MEGAGFSLNTLGDGKLLFFSPFFLLVTGRNRFPPMSCSQGVEPFFPTFIKEEDRFFPLSSFGSENPYVC